MEENVRIAMVGMLAPAVIGGMAGVGAGLLKRVGADPLRHSLRS